MHKNVILFENLTQCIHLEAIGFMHEFYLHLVLDNHIFSYFKQLYSFILFSRAYSNFSEFSHSLRRK